MKAQDLLLDKGELSHKTRTIKDLVRFINTRENKDTSNYSLFLGAGASRSSGISTASELIENWMEDLYERYENKKFEISENKYEELKNYFEHSHAGWYNGSNPYSSLFEKKFDLAPQRRRFVEQQVDKKLPSIGYAYLVSLVENNFFNTIFTTNFDDLLNESFYQLSSTRPIVCAHDSSVHSISITSKRPKILKLHGDYLFEDIKSTLRETESLEQNIKDKLIEFCKEYGLIIVGYSGSDRSIMDVLDYLIKRETYLKNGIYWCFRKNDEVNQTVKNLLWKDRVYPIIIDGFDEFFAEIYRELIGSYGELYNSDKETQRDKILLQIIKNFSNSNNDTIRKEVEELLKNRDKIDISNLINFNHNSEKKERVSLRKIKNILEISKVSTSDPEKAYELCKNYLENESLEESKIHYLKRLINLSDNLNKKSESEFWISELIKLDNMNPEYRLLKLESIKKIEERRSFLLDIISIFPNSDKVLNKYIDLMLEDLENLPDEDNNKEKLINDIERKIDKSIKINPSFSNKAILKKHKLLSIKIDFYQSKGLDKKSDEAKEDLQKIINNISSSNNQHNLYFVLLSMESDRLQNIEYSENVLNILFNIREKSSKEKKYQINNIINIILKKSLNYDGSTGYNNYHSRFYNDIFLDYHDDYSCNCLIEKSMFELTNNKDINKAKEYLYLIMKEDDKIEYINELIYLASVVDINMITDINSYIEKMKNRINIEYYLLIKTHLYSALHKYGEALDFLDKFYEKSNDLEEFLCKKTYYLLKLEKYNEVINIMEKYKDDILNKRKFDVARINLILAKKAIIPDYDYTSDVREIAASAKSKSIKIATSILLNENQGYSALNKYIKNNPNIYFEAKDWIFIDQNRLVDMDPTK